MEDYFISLLRNEYAALDPDDRKRKIQKLVSESGDNEQLIREHFPEFFEEAFPSSSSVPQRWGSGARSSLSAKPR